MSNSRQSPALDEIDIKILAVLQREGRITKLALAEQVNLSPSPCWTRLKRLEKSGFITGYHARVSLAKLAPVTVVWTEITLSSHRSQDFATFESAVQDIPEIVECWATGGGFDYLLKAVTRDVDDYQRLIDRLLMAEIGIGRYFTYVVTKAVKQSTELPLDHLLSDA